MKPGPKPRDPVARFYEKVDRTGGPDACWLWLGKLKDTGYGQFHFAGRNRNLSAAVYELFIGPVPEGWQPDHLCHSEDLTCPGGTACVHRACANPLHLELVTHGENIRRMHARRRAAA